METSTKNVVQEFHLNTKYSPPPPPRHKTAFTLKWTLRKNFIYMLTLLLKGVQTKYLNLFWLKIFSICHRCRWHLELDTMSCEYHREFSKNFETALMGYSGAWGKLIHEKDLKSKISWHCPLTENSWRNAHMSISRKSIYTFRKKYTVKLNVILNLQRRNHGVQGHLLNFSSFIVHGKSSSYKTLYSTGTADAVGGAV